jgi:cob(I)alamin adenosyltransferase
MVKLNKIYTRAGDAGTCRVADRTVPQYRITYRVP